MQDSVEGQYQADSQTLAEAFETPLPIYLLGLHDAVLDLAQARLHIEKHPRLDHPQWLGDEGGNEAGLYAGVADCVHYFLPLLHVVDFPSFISRYWVGYNRKKKAVAMAWLMIEI